MAKPSKFISTKWDGNLAYAIGLFTADGSLSIDGRHLNFSSREKEQIENFKKCLNLKNKTGKGKSGFCKDREYFFVQFGSVRFYRFLQSIGLTPRKSLTIKHVEIPDRFFADFLRGFLDGDGNINIARHPESQHLQLRVRFYSGSSEFLQWLQGVINKKLNLENRGSVQSYKKNKHTLSYGKGDSIEILKHIYYSEKIIYLKRKFAKVELFCLRRTW